MRSVQTPKSYGAGLLDGSRCLRQHMGRRRRYANWRSANVIMRITWRGPWATPRRRVCCTIHHHSLHSTMHHTAVSAEVTLSNGNRTVWTRDFIVQNPQYDIYFFFFWKKKKIQPLSGIKHHLQKLGDCAKTWGHRDSTVTVVVTGKGQSAEVPYVSRQSCQKSTHHESQALSTNLSG